MIVIDDGTQPQNLGWRLVEVGLIDGSTHKLIEWLIQLCIILVETLSIVFKQTEVTGNWFTQIVLQREFANGCVCTALNGAEKQTKRWLLCGCVSTSKSNLRSSNEWFLEVHRAGAFVQQVDETMWWCVIDRRRR